MYTIQWLDSDGVHQDFTNSLAEVKAWLEYNGARYNFDLYNVEVFLTPDNINIHQLMKDA